MLAQIRTFAKSPVATLLLGLLVVSFAVFGITDVFRNQAVKDSVVVAGSRSVGGAEYKQDFDRALKQIEERNPGQTVTVEQAATAGFDRQVADQIASIQSFGALLDKLGVAPSDKLVVQEIRKNPAFFDQVTGRFDRATYQSRLSQGGITEAQFEGQLRDQLAEAQLVSGLAAGLEVPRTYLAAIAAFNHEGRSFTWFALSPALAGPPARPTDAELTAYIKKNAAHFTKPELRQLSFVRFSAAEAAAALTVDEAEVQKRFAFEKDALSSPETRSIVQVPVKDAAAGATAAQHLKAGEDPAVVAKALGVSTVAYVDAPKTAISDRKVADAAFAPAKVGDVIGPVQGALGMAVIKIVKITPGHVATLAEARPKIEAAVKKDAATDKVYQQVQKYDDARSGGANLAEAATKAGAKVVAFPVPITAQGATLAGQKANIPPKVLQTLFSLPQSGESESIDLGQGEYVAVRVDKILPSALAGLEEVRGGATQNLVIETLQAKLKAKADEVTARLKKGETVAAVAASVGAKPETAADIRRGDATASKAFSQDFLGRLFQAKPGEVVVGDAQTLGLVVAKLDKVDPGPVKTLALDVEAQRDAFRRLLFDDMAQAARYDAQLEIKPKVDYARARTAIGLEAQAPPAGTKK